jgi:hypothetical protein
VRPIESRRPNQEMTTIRPRFSRSFTPALLLTAALLAAGCGDGDSSESKEHETGATPQEAIAEIGSVRGRLAAGLVVYRQGLADKAEQLVGDAYLEHFELVEAPLGERDAELKEELEELISTEIREAMKDGAKPARVEALVEEAQDDLTKAEKVLRG